jgi:FlaA1/EpsC-like NDP-sugar epimerase
MVFSTRALVIVHDLAMIILAWAGAYWLRDNLYPLSPVSLQQMMSLLPMVITVQACSVWLMGLYRGLWRFASMPDLIRIFKAVFLGSMSLVVVLFLTAHIDGVPRSIIPVYSVLLILFLGTGRFVQRYWKDYLSLSKNGKRVMIIGAGKAGESLVGDLLKNRMKEYRPVVLLDDHLAKKGHDLHGIPIAGKIEDVLVYIKKYHIDSIFIAIPSASTVEMRRIVSLCTPSGLEIRTLPSLHDLLSDEVGTRNLRQITIEDLLGRDPVSIDWSGLGLHIHHKVVLVTGGAGSIGSELCRQIARCEPALLIIMDRHEYGIFALEQDFKKTYPYLQCRYLLCDVRDEVAVKSLMDEHRPALVFHAAAYKHVPLLENQEREAVSNNVLGTAIMARWSAHYEVDFFVLVSTDKAVHPCNTMGRSKRAAEMLMQIAQAKSVTRFITVRFGNVLGSTGSVVPIFEEQLRKGLPLTVTHPDMTRYFMTIPEAAQLILQTIVMGQGGDLFVLDMGEPIKIQFLAEQMIRLSGANPKEVNIRYIGLRPGEKMSEELFYAEEEHQNTDHEKIFRVLVKPMDVNILQGKMDRLIAACGHYDGVTLTKELMALEKDPSKDSYVSLTEIDG